MIHRSIESLGRALPPCDRTPAVVVGLCSHGLAIVRSLARRGVPVIVIESNWSQPSAKTRFGAKLHHQDLADPSLVALLRDLATILPADPVLFVTNDKMVRLVNAHQEELRRHYRLPFPRPELLEELIEKDSLGPLAERQGLRLPHTVAIAATDAREAGRARALGARFPCVVKPATPMSAIKALIVTDENALARVAFDHPEIDRYLLQEWIAGGDERVHFTAFYFDRAGHVRGAFAGQKIRQVPRTLGNSSAARGVDRPDLIEEGLRLFHGLDYRGIASVEFKLGANGDPYFIEATVGRSDYWLKTMIVNGVDLPAIVYSDLTGEPLGARERQQNRVAWVDGDRDLWVYLESWSDPSIPKARLLAELLEPKRFALWDAGDPRPYVAWWGPLLRRLLGGVGRRLRRAPGRGPAPSTQTAPSAGEARRSE